MQEDLEVTYEEYGEMIYALTEAIRPKVKELSLKYVCGIPDGGLAIALHLSKHLKLQLITIQEYEDAAKIIPEFVLMVDDLVDSGVTMNYHSTLIDNVVEVGLTAVLFQKSKSLFKPNIVGENISSTIWVRFPWENKEEIPNRPGYEGG